MSVVSERPAARPRLPAGVEARPARPEDLEAAVDLCIRCDLADLGVPDTDPDDIRALWRRPGYDPDRHSVLVVAGGVPVGYGDMFEGEGFGMVDPGWRGRGIGAWLVGRIEELAGLAGDQPVLEVSAPASDQAYRELVERAGYRRGRSNWLMRLDMDDPPLLPAWPDGIAVRTFDQGTDARAVHRLVQDAFADISNQPSRSYEFWAEVNLGRSDFDPSLWFLATGGDQLAGVNLTYAGPLGGYVAQLAVRRGHRGRGLGLALLRHGVRRAPPPWGPGGLPRRRQPEPHRCDPPLRACRHAGPAPQRLLDQEPTVNRPPAYAVGVVEAGAAGDGEGASCQMPSSISALRWLRRTR